MEMLKVRVDGDGDGDGAAHYGIPLYKSSRDPPNPASSHVSLDTCTESVAFD